MESSSGDENVSPNIINISSSSGEDDHESLRQEEGTSSSQIDSDPIQSAHPGRYLPGQALVRHASTSSHNGSSEYRGRTVDSSITTDGRPSSPVGDLTLPPEPSSPVRRSQRETRAQEHLADLAQSLSSPKISDAESYADIRAAVPVPSQSLHTDGLTLLPEVQEIMLASFVHGGYAFLLDSLQKLAMKYERKTGYKSWKTLENACIENNGQLPIYYLLKVPYKVLENLISGQLTSSGDEQVLRLLEQIAKLEDVPAVYLNVVCRRQSLPVGVEELGENEAARKWAGHSVSPLQLEKIISTMRRYCTLSDEHNYEAQEIDYTIGIPTVDEIERGKMGRKYLPSSNALNVIKSWMDRIEIQVNKRAREEMPGQLDDPLPWCFQEVGFGVRGFKRASEHMYHSNTNYIFGLFSATTFRLYSGMFEIKQFSISTVAKPEHASFVEILFSVLAGSYSFDPWLGLNPVQAGGAHVEEMLRSRYDHSWVKARQILARPTVKDSNLAEDRRRRAVIEDSLDKVEKTAKIRIAVRNAEQALAMRAETEKLRDLMRV